MSTTRCPFYLVDAFASEPFTGNPAGVCVLEGPADEAWMQRVGFEMNQAETAFVWPIEGGFSLRWFTPTVEVDLCGHATLAAASILGTPARFLTRSGWLTAEGRGEEIVLDFPAEPAEPWDAPFDIPTAVWKGRNRMDWFVILESEQAVRDYEPDFEHIQRQGMRGLCITAPASMANVDFVSRFFAPQSGVPEDSVTGSMHCGLACLWADRLDRTAMVGYQASKRGGLVGVELFGDRVKLAGRATRVVEGVLWA